MGSLLSDFDSGKRELSEHTVKMIPHCGQLDNLKMFIRVLYTTAIFINWKLYQNSQKTNQNLTVQPHRLECECLYVQSHFIPNSLK
jgi:hypothetical protein